MMSDHQGKVLLLLAIIWVDCCWGHLRLTYPPARKYDLDFLDNVRTSAPCGMPSGENISMYYELCLACFVQHH